MYMSSWPLSCGGGDLGRDLGNGHEAHACVPWFCACVRAYVRSDRIWPDLVSSDSHPI